MLVTVENVKSNVAREDNSSLHEGVETARATMVDPQRVRSMAMLEASVSVVPSCLRSLQSPHRVRGAPRGLDHPSALGLKLVIVWHLNFS